VAEDGAVLGEARALAERLLTRAPQAVGIAKRVLMSCASADRQTGRTLESFGQSILIKTEATGKGSKPSGTSGGRGSKGGRRRA
jgi:enoyl-CoA hydratase